jgi:orotate phosphoribosyltransferase
MADLASLMLWELQAIQVNVAQPFQLTSGNWSPIYVNCRRVISDSAAMDIVASFAHWILQSEHVEADMLAGGETAGIPFASFLAARLGKPMVYVRKRAKEHGLRGLVEGRVERGQRVLLVEDLITDGQSKLDFIGALREAGGIAEDCLVLFDRLQGGREMLAQNGVRLMSITDLNAALAFAGKQGRVAEPDLAEIHAYLADPRAWHGARQIPYKG